MFNNHYLNEINPDDQVLKINDKCPICGADLYVIEQAAWFVTELTDGRTEYCANDAAHLFETGRIPGRALINRSGTVIERF